MIVLKTNKPLEKSPVYMHMEKLSYTCSLLVNDAVRWFD